MFPARRFRSRVSVTAARKRCRSARQLWLGGLWTGLCLAAPVPTLAAGEYGTAYFNSAMANYEASGVSLQTLSPIGSITDTSGHMGDWAGQIMNLEGTTVGLYDVDPQDSTHGNLGSLTALSSVGQSGLAPNTGNGNPFVLSQAGSDTFVFLLDPAQGQLTSGRHYLLQITPPPGSLIAPRRILIVVGHSSSGEATLTLTPTDGKPIRAEGGAANAAPETYVCPINENGMALLNSNVSLFPAHEIQIGISADRAAADPSDPIVYRAVVLNTGPNHLHHILIRSALSPSLKFVSGSARGQADSGDVPIAVETQGTSLTLTSEADLAPGHSLSVAYMVQVSSAAAGTTVHNQLDAEAQAFVAKDGAMLFHLVSDGPAIADVRVNQGLLSESGILIGRVFWDKNGDGRQQPEEPGIAGAVVVLDNGDRLKTDKDGLFSEANFAPGRHSAVLDLSSVPEYFPQRDRHFIAGSGASRPLRMETGGMARLSFPLERRAMGAAHP